MAHVLTKSAKGLREATGKTSDLPRDLRDVLKACKGQFVAEELVTSLPEAEQEGFALAIEHLFNEDYLREIHELSSDDDDADDSDLPQLPGVVPSAEAAELTQEQIARAGASARRMIEAAERGDAQREMEARQRDEAEAAERKSRQKERWAEQKADMERELAEKAEQARREREAAERSRAEAEAAERERIETEERLRREQAERLKRKAEEAARRAEEERQRREAEAKARAEAEEKARLEAIERAKRKAEEKAKREEDDRRRREEEARAREEAEARARAEAEERERELIRERLRGIRRRNTRIGAVTGSIIAVCGGLFIAQSMNFDGRRSAYEAIASAALGVPFKAGTAHLELFPSRWVLEDVRIGEGAASMSVQSIKLPMSLLSLASMPTQIERAELDGAKLSVESLVAGLIGPGGVPLQSGGSMRKFELTSGKLQLPPMAVTLQVENGRLTGFNAAGSDSERGKAEFAGEAASDHWKLKLTADRLFIPLGLDTEFGDVALKAELRPDRLDLQEFSGTIHSGTIRGKGALSWGGRWRLAADYEVTRMDLSKLLPGWFSDGFGAGSGSVSAEATSAPALFGTVKTSGTFNAGLGKLEGIDLEKLLQDRGQGVRTGFDSLAGRFLLDGRRAEISDVVLNAKTLVARGRIGVASDQVVSGRLTAEVRMQATRLGSVVNVSGTVAAPQFKP